MGIFGASILPSGAVQAAMPQTTLPFAQAMPQYQPPKRTLSDNLALLADAFRGNHDNAELMQTKDNRNYAQWLAQQQRAQQFANELALYQFKLKNPEPDDFTRTIRNAGIDPTSPEGQKLYRERATNLADPMQAVPGVDAQGNQVLRFMRPGESAAPPQTLGPALPQGWTIGGAGPSQAPQSFPLYPAGH